MKYIVLNSLAYKDGRGAIEIWDGKSYDPDHPGKEAGTLYLEYSKPWMDFPIGSEIELVIKVVHPVDPDRAAIEKRLEQGAGQRLSDRLKEERNKETS